MTYEEIKILGQKILAQPNIGDEEFREKVLWIVNTRPKWELGNCLLVTDYPHKAYGYNIQKFAAKIVAFKTYRWSNEWWYEFKTVYKVNNRDYSAAMVIPESKIKDCSLTDTNINILGSVPN